MKKIGILFISVLALVGCKQDFPYPGYLHVTPGVFFEAGGGTESVTMETDHDGLAVGHEGELPSWLDYSSSGSNVVLQLADNSGDARSATINVRAGLIDRKLNIYQWGTGDNQIRLIDSGWTATCSDEQVSDGGGVNSIFSDDQSSKFWHSSWSPAVPLPHWIRVDLKQEVPLSKIRLGWRNNQYHSDTRAYTILLSTDDVAYTEVASVDRGASPERNPENNTDIPPYTDTPFPITKARYVKINITQSNRGDNCNMATFIPYVSKP